MRTIIAAIEGHFAVCFSKARIRLFIVITVDESSMLDQRVNIAQLHQSIE